MTADKTDIPIKLSVMAILSITNSDGKPGTASKEDIQGLLVPVKEANLRQYLYKMERQGVLERVNPGARPAQYQLSEKGKEEYKIRGGRC